MAKKLRAIDSIFKGMTAEFIVEYETGDGTTFKVLVEVKNGWVSEAYNFNDDEPDYDHPMSAAHPDFMLSVAGRSLEDHITATVNREDHPDVVKVVVFWDASLGGQERVSFIVEDD